MAISAEYRDFIAELLAPLGPVSLRRMFGGAGAFHGDVMFGLVFQDTLYFKVDDTTRGAYEAAGMGPFTYHARSRERSLGFWQVPDTLLDEPDELCRWARAAVDVALRAARAKPRPAKKAEAATTPAAPPRRSRPTAPAAGTASRSRARRPPG
jgi:DNA transformation protein